MIGRYETATAYRQALEARLFAAYGAERVQWGRKRLAIERLIVRLQEQRPSGFLVKGGFALELRLSGQARATRDLDVVADAELGTDLESVADEIEEACAIDARDGFEFRPVGAPQEVAVVENARTLRFSVAAFLDKRRFETVPVDIRLGDLVPLICDILDGSDLLRIIGLSPPAIRLVRLEYHFAEKLHALTRPRPVGNTRIRDLLDLVLLIELGTPSDSRAWRALGEVFDHRGTHPRPTELSSPPAEWEEGYELLAKPITRVAQNMSDAWEVVTEFYRTIRT